MEIALGWAVKLLDMHMLLLLDNFVSIKILLRESSVGNKCV
jgi:hypothetical protein